MLAGALILLAASILQTGDVPGWLVKGLYFGGYVLLAYGFFTAMNARRGGTTPRDRG